MSWLLGGECFFGFLVGLLTGLSESKVVGTALPLLFTFAGGSTVTLSVGDGITPATRKLLGLQLIWFSIGVVVGLAAGLVLRHYGIKLPFTGIVQRVESSP